MGIIKLDDLKQYITEKNKYDEGKEVAVYQYGNQLIKIFHNNRNSLLERISDEGLYRLSNLSLKHFNTPIDIIQDNEQIVGYTEKILFEEGVDINSIDYDGIREDIEILSKNGFTIQDLYYNYMFSNHELIFYDLTSYKYINTTQAFLQETFYKNNIKEINIFLIGLTQFDAFRTKNKETEYTKIYLANEYRLEYCPNEYYGNTLNTHKSK